MDKEQTLPLQPEKKPLDPQYQKYDPNFDYLGNLQKTTKDRKDLLDQQNKNPLLRPSKPTTTMFSGQLEKDFPELTQAGFLPKDFGQLEETKKTEFKYRRGKLIGELAVAPPAYKQQRLTDILGPERAKEFNEYLASYNLTLDQLLKLDPNEINDIVERKNRLENLMDAQIRDKISINNVKINDIGNFLKPVEIPYGNGVLETLISFPDKKTFLAQLEAKDNEERQTGKFLNTVKTNYQPKNKDEAKVSVIKEAVKSILPDMTPQEFVKQTGENSLDPDNPRAIQMKRLYNTRHQYAATVTDPLDKELDNPMTYVMSDYANLANRPFTLDDVQKTIDTNSETKPNAAIWKDLIENSYLSYNGNRDLMLTNKITGRSLFIENKNSVFYQRNKNDSVIHVYNGKAVELGSMPEVLYDKLSEFAQGRAIKQAINKHLKDGDFVETEILGKKMQVFYIHQIKEYGYGDPNKGWTGGWYKNFLMDRGSNGSVLVLSDPSLGDNDNGWKMVDIDRRPLNRKKKSLSLGGHEYLAVSTEEVTDLILQSIHHHSANQRKRLKEKWPKTFNDFVKKQTDLVNQHVGQKLYTDKGMINEPLIITPYGSNKQFNKYSSPTFEQLKKDNAVVNFYKQFLKEFTNTEHDPTIVVDFDDLEKQRNVTDLSAAEYTELTSRSEIMGSIAQTENENTLGSTVTIMHFVNNGHRDRQPSEIITHNVATLFHETGHILDHNDLPKEMSYIHTDRLNANNSNWLKTNRPHAYKFAQYDTGYSIVNESDQKQSWTKSIEGLNSLKELYLTSEFLKKHNINMTMNNTPLNGYTDYMIHAINFIMSDTKLRKKAAAQKLRTPADFGKFILEELYNNPENSDELLYQLANLQLSKSKKRFRQAYDFAKHLKHVSKYSASYLQESDGAKQGIEYLMADLTAKGQTPRSTTLKNYDGFKNAPAEYSALLGYMADVAQTDLFKDMNTNDFGKVINWSFNLLDGHINFNDLVGLLVGPKTKGGLKLDNEKARAIIDFAQKDLRTFLNTKEKEGIVLSYKGYGTVFRVTLNRIFMKAAMEVGI